jgi:phenylpropionate dioxygenase-like ring-hydroxylating dioxygenase large terminal subunit
MSEVFSPETLILDLPNVASVSNVLRRTWLPLADAAAVRRAGMQGVKLLDEDLLVVALGADLEVWQDLCVHRGTKLSLGTVQDTTSGRQVVCPYHGWTYAAGGQCVKFPSHPTQTPPARAHARRYPVTERYGLVWTCLDATEGEVPAFPDVAEPGMRSVICGPYTFRAAAPRVVENFLDVAHFPFVHAGLLGDAAMPEIPDYPVEVEGHQIIARDIRVFQPDPDGSGVGREVSYTYQVTGPLSAHFSKQDDSGQRFSIFLSVTPASEVLSLGWFIVALNYGTQTDDEIRAFQDRVAMQDLPIVESQRPERLPLDLQAELHLRSDRVAIAYRTMLRRIGLEFGTA